MRTVLLCLLLTGCATAYWHPSNDSSRTAADKDDCEYKAQVATASMPSGIERGMRLSDIRHMCMQQMGYSLIQK